MSIKEGRKRVSFGFMFSGSFGVRSIVLCKCSGKYIDIYFILKITCFCCSFVLSATPQTGGNGQGI